jgi:AraC-like DNA-binding protein
MAGFELDYEVPAADLSPYVTLFYRFVAPVARFEDVERADHAQLRFRLTPGGGSYRFGDGTEQDSPAVHLVGPTSAAFRTASDGPLVAFGMGLTPAGWNALTGIDASTMVNRSLDATRLFGPAMLDTQRALAACSDLRAMVAVIGPVLRGLMAAREGDTLAFCRAVDDWLATEASPAVDALVSTSGLSRRQVERRVKALYGCPPKLLARKYRALRAAAAIAAHDREAADALTGEGFYDQSHMIREIKQFTGLTPRQMRDAPGPLAELTIRERRALGGRVIPIISDT